MKKEYIHIVNGEGGIYLDIVEKLFGKEEVRKTIREDFNKVKKELLLSNIDYADLRKVLIPFANAFSYFFSKKDLPNYMYFSKIYKQIILMLSKQEKAIFLCGDLMYDYSMNNEIKDLFEKYEINCKDFEESDFCNVIIVGITINSANKISEMLKEKFKAYRGYCNITNPSKMKEFCFSFAIQKSIKIGYKLIHSCPDEYDKSNYSGFCIKENTELSKYTLVPIIEELYGSFLTFRPFIDKIPKKELLYSLNAFYDLDDIKKATEYAHSLNKKVYVTVNIVFHNENLEGLKDYLLYLENVNVDGIIASDIVVLKMIKDLKLKTKVILSTQASTLNSFTAEFYKDFGVDQIVLAREALTSDIKAIKGKTGLELECFVHGAMCMSISGKCILSSFMTGRDSNRGGCAQICRWVFNEDKTPFTMTPKDLNMIENIKEMIDLGVTTFKVEGRMRSIYYISTVILCYRKIIDKILNNNLTEKDKSYYLKILNRVANRDSAPQFFKNLPSVNDQYYNLRDEESNQDFLGIVKSYDENTHIAVIEERNFFRKGDNIQFFGPNTETFDYTVNEIYNENDELIEKANMPRMIIKLKVDRHLNENDLLRVKIN